MPTSSTYFTWDIDAGVATLIFDTQNEKINKLSTAALSELAVILDTLAKTKTIKVLIFKSGKTDIFIAGADIQEILEIKDEKEGFQKAKAGQDILNKLAIMPFPTIAVIHGAALGGGLELALACTYRIATDHPKTLLGLPEVNLGIIPGFGGTQRLPKLIGLSRALDLILTGRAIDAQKAYKLGILDSVTSPAFLEEKLAEFLEIINNKTTQFAILRHRRLLGFKGWFLDRSYLGRWLVCSQAKKTVLSKTKGQYPAPLLALKSVKFGYFKSLPTGLNYELKQFSQLVTNTISKNLIHLFFTQEQLKKDSGIPGNNVGYPIKRAGVLGAGLMGGGISWALSNAGILTRLKDIQWEAIGKGYAAAEKIFLKNKRLSKAQKSLALSRISGTLTFQGFTKAELVIEAIVEDMALKKKVFTELESNIAKDTIVATNTSALSVSEMAQAFQNPERFIGMHFFSPVDKMPLVEVIPGHKTSPQTIATVVQLAKTLKKTPIVVKDVPGFLVNRILIPYINEAVRLLEEGVPIQTIDRIMTDFGLPIGPLALADEVGLDVGYKVAKILEHGYPDRMQVSDGFNRLFTYKELRGKKTGQGFYVYENQKKQPNAQVVKILGAKTKRPPKSEECLDRMILTMVNEAARCISEGVVENPDYLDIAMILGTGFPPFRGGLLRYADQRGLDVVVKRLELLRSACGDRFTPAPLLKIMQEKNQTFTNINTKAEV